MADKPRKSVAFADGGDDVDVTEVANGEKETTEAQGETDATRDKEVDEVTAMFEGLAKKKKKKSVKKEGDEEEAVADDGEVDLSALKKKKKKKAKTTEDDFEKQLAEAGVADDKDGEEGKDEEEAVTGVQDGDVHGGTGIWAHDEVKNYNYESLLSRFFLLLHDSHPDLASSGGKSYKIPPPQCLREGNKKTIFANIADICKRMKRTDEHVTSFLFAELGTSGSVDGSRRLVIKGRFQQKQIENVLRRYIGEFSANFFPGCNGILDRAIANYLLLTVEYVTCKTCRSPDTELNKGENRLYFVTCNSCGSRRSVTAIKTGFSAQVGKRKRIQG
jgi:translation initiation factor 2 subunit 2